MAVDDIAERAAVLGIDFSQVDLRSIKLPPGEDFGIISDDEDLTEEEMEFDDGYGNILVVDNLPEVMPDKFDRLELLISKIYSKYGVIKEDGFWMLIDEETRKTLGYCFIEFNTSQEAKLAKEKTDGYRLDKAHVLSVYLFEDIEKLMNVPEIWTAPKMQPYEPTKNLQRWLTDAKARDQFVIRAGDDTEVLWNDARHLKPESVYTHHRWTESLAQWSPLGTYLATVHRKGAVVWGGDSSFGLIKRYEHTQVKLIDFSPGEKFIVTYSIHEPSNPCDTQTVELKIFDTRTGKLKRGFEGSADEFAVGGSGGLTGISWPIIKWAGGRDDKYFARIRKNVVSVYETETFYLIDKKSMEVENVMDFSWSPTDPILALFVPELGNQPAKMSLFQIPSKAEIRQKNLFSVSDCKMYWQSNGEYLAVKVDRYTKTKKTSYSGFELFRIKERDIPIEVLELENKNDKIIAFAWEPKGHRFAVIHGDNPRPDISFYSMKSTHHTSRVSKLTTLKSKQANAIYWSPSGRYVILAGLKGLNGQLEFFDVDDLETMSTAEHFMCSLIEWDPSGRYVATAVTTVHEMENGFHIWSLDGKLQYRILKDRLFQFQWRPRPPSLLTPEKEEEIAKNIKNCSKKYKAEDQDASLMLSEQDRETRRLLMEEWGSWLAKWKSYHDQERLERQNLRDGVVSYEEEEYEAKEIEYEEIIGVKEDIVL